MKSLTHALRVLVSRFLIKSNEEHIIIKLIQIFFWKEQKLYLFVLLLIILKVKKINIYKHSIHTI